MKDYCVVIPLHIFNDDVKILLKKSLESVINNNTDVEVFVSSTKEILNAIKNDKDDIINNVTPFIVDDDKTGFCDQINAFAKDCKYKWFSILEYDDQYSPIWFKNFENYSLFQPSTSIFLSLTELFDYSTNNLMSLANEIVWATSFSEEVGFVDTDSLDIYSDYNVTGAFINTFDFNEVGGLKSSMKLSFWNEFLMRSCGKGKKIFVVPKIGYSHYLGRENSLSEIYSKTINEDEAKWWLNLAKTECYFTDDRKKTYDNNSMEKITDLK